MSFLVHAARTHFLKLGACPFLSIVQGVGESDDDFLARLREEARYCDFEKLKTVTNPEEELIKIKFISGLRDPEAKLGLLDGIETKPTMSLSELTECLQFRSQAMAFASSSTGNRPFVIKEKVGYNFKIPSENLVKSSLVIKALVTCVKDEEVNHIVASRIWH